MTPARPPSRVRGVSDRFLSGVAAGGVALFVLGVSAGAFWALHRIDTAVRETVRRTLTTVLATARESSRHWATRQQALVASLATSGELGQEVEVLTLAMGRTSPPESALRAVHRVLEPGVRTNGLDGYWVVGIDQASLIRWPDSLPATLPEFILPALEKALDGLPGLSPFPADSSAPRLLTATAPIRNARGQIIAALVLALPARRELSRLAEQSHHRSLGQSYFFDHAGRVLGTSYVRRQEPLGALLVEPGSLRLTRMAESATSGTAGVDLDGYPDYRGVEVVGAWEWDAELGLGRAAESDTRLAYHVSETARNAVFVGLAITMVLFLTVLASLIQTRRRSQALSALQRRLAAVLESTTDPVCFADRNGQAIYLNDAGRALLGGGGSEAWSAAQPPSWSQVLLRPDALEQAAAAGTWSGESTVLTAAGREVTLSQVILCHRGPAGSLDFYSTIARDISERKQLERRLFEEKERAEVTLGSIGDAVVRTDSSGIIEYLNPVAEQLLNCRRAELAGRPISSVLSLVHEGSREPIENPVETCLREKRVVGRSNLSLLIRPDGREFAIDDSAAPSHQR